MRIIFNSTSEAKKVASKINALVSKELMDALEGSYAYLCGGAIVSLISDTKVNDLDFFFPSEESFNLAISRIKVDKDEKGWSKKMFESDNAVSFWDGRMKIQMVKKVFFEKLEDTINIFDFRAVMCAMTLNDIKEKSGFYSEENTIFDIARKLLVVMPNHRNPHNVSYRIAKYVERGWKISGQSFVRLTLQQLIRGKSIKTLADVKDEIMGLDTVILADYFKKFDKFPPTQPIEELELKEMIKDIDDHFDEWLFGQKDQQEEA